MRRFLFLVSFLFAFGTVSYSQLPNGSDAPDWTLVDINGETHNLYSYLNDGVDVIIDFSATWCGPCWSYHSTHTLNNYYNAHGPNGTGDVMVFFIEGDLSTNENCLYGTSGCVGGTQGDWVSGINYPIINLTSTNGPGVTGQYQIAFWPTIYLISSQNKKVYRDGQPSTATLDSWILGSFDMAMTGDIQNANCGGDGAIDQTVTAGYGNKTYAWSSGENTEDIDYLDPGAYNCMVTDAHDYSVLSDDYYVDGVLAPLFFNTTNMVQPSCYGAQDGIITIEGLFGNGGYSYEWSTGSTSSTLTDIGAGTYYATVTDSGNCTYEGEVTLGQPDQVVATASAPMIPCGQSFGTITVTASGGAGGFSYDIGFGPQSSGVFPNLSPGTYNFHAFDVNGCESDQGAVTLGIQSAPAAQTSQSGDITCANTQSTVSGSGSATGSDITYAWSTSNGNIVSGQNTINAVVSSAGTYTLMVVNTQTGCQSSSSVTVNSNTTVPSLTVTNGELTCGVNSVEICATTDNGLTPSWTINGQQVSGSCVNVTAAGTYSASVMGTNGCQNSAQSTVTASTDLPSISIAAPEQLTCTNTQTTLAGSVVGDPNDFTIAWTTTDGNIVSGQNTLNPVISEPGTYVMSATNNSTSCSSISQTTVTEFINSPNGAFTSTQNGAIFNGQATSTGAGNTYAWDFGNGSTSTDAQVSYTFTTPGTYDICLTVTNECGSNMTCSSFTYTATLAVTSTLSPATCHDSNDGAIAIAITGGNPEYTIAWTGPNGFTSDQASISNLAPGQYTVVVTDGVGYQVTEVYQVAAPSVITVSNVIIYDDTDNKNTGSINVSVGGGNGNYTFLWSNGSTSDGLTNVGAGDYTLQVTDEKGCVQTFGPYTVSNVVAVDESKIVNKFTIHPNPASNFIELNAVLVSESDVFVKISNSLGKAIATQSYYGNILEKIDVSQYASGVYYVSLRTAKGEITRRFMVIK